MHRMFIKNNGAVEYPHYTVYALFVTKATTCYAGGKGKALARKEVTK